MVASQNGYKANDRSLIATYIIPETKVKISLRKGDVSVVLLHFASWFNKNISPLAQKDTGGYAERPIAGSSTLSNHASGTAEDLDWNAHPMGKANTFTAAQQKKIRTQLKYYESVIRWGGDYKGRKDDMHFEINANLTSVKKIADKIRLDAVPKPIPKPVVTKPVAPKPALLKVDGDLGPATIKRWQQIMGTKVDGVITENSPLVEAVQRRLKTTVDHNLVVDGDGDSFEFGVKRKTVEALQRYLKVHVTRRLSSENSDTIKQLQRRLNTGKF